MTWLPLYLALVCGQPVDDSVPPPPPLILREPVEQDYSPERDAPPVPFAAPSGPSTLSFRDATSACDPSPGVTACCPPPCCCVSYLAQPCYCIDHCVRVPLREYYPQPGDIMLTTDTSMFWKIMHNVAGSGHPIHSGIVFQRPDGRMAVLEAGPHDTLHCRTLDAVPHFKSYYCKGRIWIRRRVKPLTPCQSAALTRFALANDGKWFAAQRLGVQLTPLRTRGPIKTWFVGKPHGERHSYFCSELVCEACVAAGIMNPHTARPSATYPRDLYLDRSLNPYLNRHLHLAPCWDPPARWFPCNTTCCATQPCASVPTGVRVSTTESTSTSGSTLSWRESSSSDSVRPASSPTTSLVLRPTIE